MIARPGALIISLDFELFWGMRDRYPDGTGCRTQLLGARAAVPLMLQAFARYGVQATWACVGFLFGRSGAELRSFNPVTRPAYANRSLDPYAEKIGSSELADPLRLAPSLIAQIADTPGQEIGSHTYSHYYCTEPGQDVVAFAADLDAAVAIAKTQGVQLKSIVFPRNQHEPRYNEVLSTRGIRVYRGNPSSWHWNLTPANAFTTAGRRAVRCMESYTGLFHDGSYNWSAVSGGSDLVNVPASMFLRPLERSRILADRRLTRILNSMRNAAREGRVYHLWWHPHNFGHDVSGSLRFLEFILEEFSRCRAEFGFQSLNMGAAAEVAIAARIHA